MYHDVYRNGTRRVAHLRGLPAVHTTHAMPFVPIAHTVYATQSSSDSCPCFSTYDVGHQVCSNDMTMNFNNHIAHYNVIPLTHSLPWVVQFGTVYDVGILVFGFGNDGCYIAWMSLMLLKIQSET